MNNEIMLETKLVGDITGSFYVPSYQRGYRWGSDEVTRLLEDVYQNGKKNYCLQPVVVKKRGDSFELIDGQQRLTTLYLIYKYIRNVNPFYPEPTFSLTYETREKSEEFLKSINLFLKEDNIDFWFMANAYETIKKWFEADLQMRVTHIFEYFKEDVKIIWYEVGETEDAIALFTRLNIGKIPLTSAELIKAMFICNPRDDEDTLRPEEIGLRWDNIEKELHNDDLWYFLTNKPAEDYQTRIDLVLDLMAEKPETNRDKYYTYFFFDSNKESLSIKDIERTFLLLKGWYEDHTLYHKIGYLIASGSKNASLQNIYNKSLDMTKSEFKDYLDNQIRESINYKKNYSELSYDIPDDYPRISRLLLLFNVESVRSNGAETQWFPFDEFKYSKGKPVTWSLEHIHAQQSEGLKTQEMWKEWLKLHIPSLRSLDSDHEELIEEMSNAIDKEKLERNEFEAIQQKVIELLSVKGNTEYMHCLANMALLNAGDNAALNNSTFDVKRKKVVEMDKQGQYIPFCTKMVFLKYYTPIDKNQLHFWGQADRVAYIEAMNKVLDGYLKEPIEFNWEEA
ncbi:Uncharacterized conserved protein, contains ParB-like and HNH nuclease domains [Ruminococcaceae bacterium KH2T8]|nr:Uncharacterized conserved protein, contains ParB-like and HNH nuclease domains [Ruminococcaceae bacterium KH2T8]